MNWDMSGLPRSLVQKISDRVKARHRVEVSRALARQAAVAKEYRDNPPRPIGDFARQTMALDPVLDSIMAHQQGGTWRDDADCVKWFLNKDEHGKLARVETKSGKTQIGFGNANRSAVRPGGFIRTRPGRLLKVYG